MVSFEQACSDTERAAENALKSAGSVSSQIRALAKAARTGDIAGRRRCLRRLNEVLATLQQEVSNIGSCWPFSGEGEQELFGPQYSEELKAAASTKGLKIHEREGSLISYPSIVRILPAERVVMVDRKKVSTVRPSYLAGLLLTNQKKSSGFSSQRFLESLYTVYTDLAEIAKKSSSNQKSSSGLLPDSGRVMPLARIYKLMTALPGSARDYGRSDFARDLYILESHGPRRTKDGAAVSFPSSTGARKRSSDLFSFIGPNGDNAEYYGVRFSKGGE